MRRIKAWWQEAVRTSELLLKMPPEREESKEDQAYDTWLQGILAAVGGGLIGTILSGRGSSSIAKLGGGLAILAFAYRAYSNYCGNSGKPPVSEQIKGLFRKRSTNQEEPIDLSRHSQAILMATINLAKVRGELSADRRAEIVEELTPLVNDQAMMNWMIEELDRPYNLTGLVALGKEDPMIAVEIYMVTLTSIDHHSAIERTYLAELKAALGIDQDLAESIDHVLPSTL